MVNGLQKNEAQMRQAGQAINNHLWNREAHEAAERANRAYARQMEDWRARVKGSKQQDSKRLLQYLKVHLQKVFPLHEFFQMSMKLFVRMIQRRKLRLHSLRFQRKPLRQEAKAFQQGSTEWKSLPGLVPSGSSPLHLQSFQDLLQPLQHIHLVHLSRPFLSQTKNLRHWQH